jgi:gamma-glutamyl-gamma-aminobutyraldehyde dehydrogenase
MTTAGALTDWASLAGRLDTPTELLIDGQWVPAADGKRLDVVSPIDGSVIRSIALGSAADIDRAVANARTAFEDGRWSRTAPAERKAVLIAWADLITAHREELAVLQTLEMGKPAHESWTIDLRSVANTIRWNGEAIDKILDEIPHTEPNSLALITREPAGVVGAIVPWNFPLVMAAWKLGPALAAGCSVVLKPAEQSPLSALLLAKLALEAGIPPGVLNVVNGLGVDAGAALSAHRDVDVLAFTGSTNVGRSIMEAAAKSNLKRVWLELGGKSANIIFPDADVERAANTAAWSIFFNQGEMCTAGSRLLVHESLHDEVVQRVLAIAETMQPTNPLSAGAPAGALVNATHLGRVHAMVEQAKGEGSRLVIGGAPTLVETGGCYYPPTVFDHVSPDGYIAQHEVFGPVLAISTFSTEEEAIRIANSTDYGLASGVWTNDLSRAHRVSRALKVGVCWVNCYEEGDMTFPFGGVKMSGFGRDKSLHALDKFMDMKSTWIQL